MAKKQQAASLRAGRRPEAGDVYLIEIQPGVYGARRLLQVRTKGRQSWYLLATTPWFGKTPPSLDEPRLREILRLTHHEWKNEAQITFVPGNPPEGCRWLGNFPPTRQEQKLKCTSYGLQNADWLTGLDYHVITQWRWDH